MKPIIRVIHNLPRSGGTLFARCLGCMDNVALLSEIHPAGSAAVDPVTQARQWFQYPIPEGLSFIDTIETIRQIAETSRRSLVIREWSFPDFLPRAPDSVPPMKSALIETLADKYEVVRLSLLRDCIHTLLSLRKFEDSSLSADTPRTSIDSFMLGYEAFLEMAVSVGEVITYEDLCRQPTDTMRIACSALQLPFDASFSEKWLKYKNVTGDVANFGRTTIGSP